MIEVAAAIIIFQNKILCFQRGLSKYDYVSYKYEFPGGKLNQNEDPITALKREINEELRIEINIQNKFKTIFFKYPDFEIKMHCYICTTSTFSGKLYEHIDYKLMDIKNLDQLDWIEADIKLVKELMEKYITLI
jgi:8-oxo-dGTP diphosphatase